jgi:predicted polyphosphate/ATP-dependent NAD kinase
MSIVGIIANPSSGKDIRRIVAQAFLIGNREKSNIIRRALIGIAETGVKRVLIMPGKFGIGQLAIDDLKRSFPEVVARAQILDMDFVDSDVDSIRAANLLRDIGAGCIITIGGDGTTRVVSKGCGEVPLLPISTGTNNVLPQFVEGTIAGLAAGIIAQQGKALRETLCYRCKRLEILVNGEVVDYALIDVAAISTSFTGSKAVWEAEKIRQVAVTRAAPNTIGLSTLVGMVRPISPNDPYGAVVSLSFDGRKRIISAPIGPGLIAHLRLGEIVLLEPNQTVPVASERPLILALDGERELSLKSDDEAELRLTMNGPWIVNVERVLDWAVRKERFLLPRIYAERE